MKYKDPNSWKYWFIDYYDPHQLRPWFAYTMMFFIIPVVAGIWGAFVYYCVMRLAENL